MYDAKGFVKEFVADSREEALAKAVQFFGVEEAELRSSSFDLQEVGGLGDRCLVVAAPKNRGGEQPQREKREPKAREMRTERKTEEKSEEKVAPENRTSKVNADENEKSGEVEVQGAAASEIGEFVEGLVKRMAVGSFSIEESEEGNLSVISIGGDAALELTSGGGRVVDAIQFLVNQASMRGEEGKRVVLEVEGDADQREAYLTKLADRAAKRAQSAARAMALDPMNPKDRRIVHVALRDCDGIATMSVGSGRYRRVVVVPEGAPEYEDAVRENQTSRKTS